MKILFASNDNAVYRAISTIIEKTGHQINRIGSTNVDEIVSGYNTNDYLLLNQVSSVNRMVLKNISDRARIIDLSLAKTSMRRYGGQFISLSVLVLPSRELRDLKTRIILATDISSKDSENTIKQILGEIPIEKRTADESDKIISEVLVKPYLLSLISRKVSDLDYEMPTSEYSMVQELARLVTNYNVDQIRDMLRNNPHTGEIVASLEENVKRVWNELSNY